MTIHFLLFLPKKYKFVNFLQGFIHILFIFELFFVHIYHYFPVMFLTILPPVHILLNFFLFAAQK